MCSDGKGGTEVKMKFNLLCFVKSENAPDILPVYNIVREIVLDFVSLA